MKLRRRILGLGLALAGLWAAPACSSFGGTPDPDVMATLARNATYANAEFVNQVPTPVGFERGFWPVLREWAGGDQIRRPDHPVPVFEGTAAALATPPESGLRLTWMGHSSVLIEIDGVRVLTDPIWSERCSPSQLVGPDRYAPTPIALADLPPIDAVVISHDHYDHLDEATIEHFAETDARFFVPLGVGAHLRRWGVAEARIVELDWWQRGFVPGTQVQLVTTPARHFSGRSLTDRNETLWASWVVRGPAHRVYFGGDTGLFDGFAEIGAREGPFDATLMPIGAYNPDWHAVHLDPEEAVVAHQQVGGAVLLPIHWSTFNLAFHDWFEPILRLQAAAREARVEIAVPRIGEPVEPSRPQPIHPWWPIATANL